MFTHHHAFFRPLALAAALFSVSSFAEQATVIHQPVAKGLYELAYSPKSDSLFVASALGRGEPGGVIYRLNPANLSQLQALKNEYKPFGVALNTQTNVLYLGNSRDSSVTSVDATTGAQLRHLVLDGRKRSETVKPLQVREIAIDTQDHRLYIPGVGAESVVWVVDAKNLTLLRTIENTGKIATGLAIDNANHTLYVSNSDGELLIIDTRTDSIIKRVRLAESGKSALLNITLDQAGHRLFISDFKQPGVLVVDTRTDKLITKINVPESLSVLFNGARNELYVTHRQAGTVSIIDATDYSVKQTVKAPGLPNSLALSADGQALFVTVKQPASRDKPATAPDEVMRISL